MPAIHHSARQRYVAAEVDVPIFSADGILEYCNAPRLKAEMPAHKIGKQWRFYLSEVDEWVKSRGQNSAPEDKQ